jgi:penicillin-binding protein A
VSRSRAPLSALILVAALGVAPAVGARSPGKHAEAKEKTGSSKSGRRPTATLKSSGQHRAHTAATTTTHESGGAPKLNGAAVDPALQKVALRLLEETKAHEGAIVLSDVRTGRVLVWASRGSATRDFVREPFAPSASLFKVVTAAALLESGKVTPRTKQCWSGGERRIEKEDLVDDRSRDDRCATFGEALGHSINLVFARLALKHLTPDALRDTAAELGIGSEIPIDIRVPRSALTIKEDDLGFARSAAGFWNGHLSPLSALFVMQTIANRGERVRLHLLASTPALREDVGMAMSPETADTLTRMLEVTTRQGTSAKVFGTTEAHKRFAFGRVAGKTGTLVGSSPRRMYSWFAGFAPSRKPEVAISVMLGNDVHWWKKANEVGRELLEAYFEQTHGHKGKLLHHRGGVLSPRPHGVGRIVVTAAVTSAVLHWKSSMIAVESRMASPLSQIAMRTIMTGSLPASNMGTGDDVCNQALPTCPTKPEFTRSVSPLHAVYLTVSAPVPATHAVMNGMLLASMTE